MPNTKHALKLFLCHAHSDKDAVKALYTRLTKDGVDAWLDKEKLLPGADWEYEIRKAVHEADVVIVCLSKEFNNAGFRQKEVRLALEAAMEKPEGEIFIIPARLEECDTLASLEKWHWVDLFEMDGYEKLMLALRLRANRIGAVLQSRRSWLPKITAPVHEQKELVASIEDNHVMGNTSLEVPTKVPTPDLLDYRIKTGWTYGIAITLTVLLAILMFLFLFYTTTFLPKLIFFVAFLLISPLGIIWAVATRRRWVFFVTWSITVCASTASAILYFVFSLRVSTVISPLSPQGFLLIIIPILLICLIGLFVDIFLFQVSIAKRFYEKGLWSLIGGLIFTIAWLLFAALPGVTEVLILSIISIFVFAFCLLLITYIGNGFGAFLKRILPKLFEGFTPSINVPENIFSKSLRIFWQWIDLFDIKIYEYLMGIFGKDGDKNLTSNSETASEDETQTTIKHEEKQKSLEINRLEKGLMLLFLILVIIVIFSINNILIKDREFVTDNNVSSNPSAVFQVTHQPSKTPQQPLSDLLVAGTYTPTPIYWATPHSGIALDDYNSAMEAYSFWLSWGYAAARMANVATLEPGSADAIYFIGETKRLDGQYPEAIDYYNQAIKINPRYAPSYFGRARVNVMFEGQYHVLGDLNRAITLDANYTEAYLERGMYLLSKDDPESAKSDLMIAARLNPNSPLVQLNLARVLLKLGENKAALAAAQKAKTLDVTLLDAYKVLSMAYRANGNIKDANETENFLKVYTSLDSLTPEMTETLPKMPTRMPTSTVEPIPTPLPAILPDARNVPMVLVPGDNMPASDIDHNLYLRRFSSFTMGSEQGDADEKPVSQITLDTVYIDKYEVTNSSYKACVESGRCQLPLKTSSRTHPSYYGNAQFDNYPVIYVDWNMAKTYCGWRDARLPSEAEWEKAARGIDARTYPWGENIDKSYANYGQNVGDTKAVGSYESGKSIFGAYDMAGNVWEWVADWYIGEYFVKDGSPIVPLLGEYRALRGGSWYDPAHAVRAANREYNIPSDKYYLVGFRCARSFP